MDLWLICLTALSITTVHSINYTDHVTTNSTHDFRLSGLREDAIYSLDGNTRFVMQSDGNAVLSSRASSTSTNWYNLWRTWTYTMRSTDASYFAVQRDRNLVVYTEDRDGNDKAVWASLDFIFICICLCSLSYTKAARGLVDTLRIHSL